MNGDININLKINKKIGLIALAIVSCFALGNFVSVVDAQSNGGVTVVQPEESAPIGTIALWASTTPPDGWIEMNGQSTAGYSELASIVGSNVPDLRGEFVRGWDSSRGIDSGRTFKSYQAGTKIAGEAGDSNSMNTHTIHNINNVYGDPIYETDFNKNVQYDTATGEQSLSNSSVWWKTVRPRNVALMYIIRAE